MLYEVLPAGGIAEIPAGGALAFISHDGSSDIGELMNKAGNIDSSYENSKVGDILKVVKEEIIKSGQQEGVTYREVTYDDGGFRQYDVETGKLIGSSYDSDQEKLPNMD